MFSGIRFMNGLFSFDLFPIGEDTFAIYTPSGFKGLLSLDKNCEKDILLDGQTRLVLCQVKGLSHLTVGAETILIFPDRSFYIPLEWEQVKLEATPNHNT